MGQVLTNDPLEQAISSEIASASWFPIMRGVIAVVFGFFALMKPGMALSALIILFGAYAIVDGVLAMIGCIRMAGKHDPWLALLFEGVVGIAAGIIAFRTPGITALALLFVIAAWAIITGILEIAAAFELRKYISGEWALGLSGLLSIVFGWLLFWQPHSGILALVWIVGIYAILFGALMLYVGSQMRRLAES